MTAIDRVGRSQEFAIATDIVDLHAKTPARWPDRLHRNLKTMQARPWGAREAAVLDRAGVCVVFRPW